MPTQDSRIDVKISDSIEFVTSLRHIGLEYGVLKISNIPPDTVRQLFEFAAVQYLLPFCVSLKSDELAFETPDARIVGIGYIAGDQTGLLSIDIE